MPSSLRKIAQSAISAVNEAKFLFGSHKEITVFVEGLKDVRFYKEFKTSDLRIVELGDKDEVLKAFSFVSTNPHIIDKSFAHFVVDIDKDFLLQKKLIQNPFFNYHVWDVSLKNGFNDLETYLVWSRAFDKLMVNYDIDTKNVQMYRRNLFDSASYIGAYRLADEQIQKQYSLRKSVLDGVELDDQWFDDQMSLDKIEFDKYLSMRLKNNSYEGVFFDCADENKKIIKLGYELCRGHDLSNIIALCLMKKNEDLHLDGDIIELDLRLAAEKAFLDQSQIANFSFWSLM